jgi:hypothetical protein
MSAGERRFLTNQGGGCQAAAVGSKHAACLLPEACGGWAAGGRMQAARGAGIGLSATRAAAQREGSLLSSAGRGCAGAGGAEEHPGAPTLVAHFLHGAFHRNLCDYEGRILAQLGGAPAGQPAAGHTKQGDRRRRRASATRARGAPAAAPRAAAVHTAALGPVSSPADLFFLPRLRRTAYFGLSHLTSTCERRERPRRASLPHTTSSCGHGVWRMPPPRYSTPPAAPGSPHTR